MQFHKKQKILLAIVLFGTSLAIASTGYAQEGEEPEEQQDVNAQDGDHLWGGGGQRSKKNAGSS